MASSSMSVARTLSRGSNPASLNLFSCACALVPLASWRRMLSFSSTYSTTIFHMGRGKLLERTGSVAWARCRSMILSWSSFRQSTCSLVRGNPSTRTPVPLQVSSLEGLRRASMRRYTTLVSGTMPPEFIVDLTSGSFLNSELHSMGLSVKPLVRRMKFVLAPLPAPGAPLSHTISRGTHMLSLPPTDATSRPQHSSKISRALGSISTSSESTLGTAGTVSPPPMTSASDALPATLPSAASASAAPPSSAAALRMMPCGGARQSGAIARCRGMGACSSREQGRGAGYRGPGHVEHRQ
mmetsp:Transcript_978/g.3768  ORF Transcript_978/g.3768 Transcript_978/m.3768 type:complete len:297 (+) Transcript_978:1019-1909(+)